MKHRPIIRRTSNWGLNPGYHIPKPNQNPYSTECVDLLLWDKIGATRASLTSEFAILSPNFPLSKSH